MKRGFSSGGGVFNPPLMRTEGFIVAAPAFGAHFRENITVQRAASLGLRGEAWRMMQNIRGADGRSAVIKASPC